MSFFSNDHIQKLKLTSAAEEHGMDRAHGAMSTLHPPRQQAPKAKPTASGTDYSEPKPEPTGWH